MRQVEGNRLDGLKVEVDNMVRLVRDGTWVREQNNSGVSKKVLIGKLINWQGFLAHTVNELNDRSNGFEALRVRSESVMGRSDVLDPDVMLEIELFTRRLIFALDMISTAKKALRVKQINLEDTLTETLTAVRSEAGGSVSGGDGSSGDESANSGN
jgi:hypothetical protein